MQERVLGPREVQESIRNAKHVCSFVVESTLACKKGAEWTDETRDDALRTLARSAVGMFFDRANYFLPLFSKSVHSLPRISFR